MTIDLANSDPSTPSESKQPSNPDDKESAPYTGSELPGYSAVRSDANSEPNNTSAHAIDRPKKRKTSNAFSARLEPFSRPFSDTLKTLFLFYELEGRKETIVDYFVTCLGNRDESTQSTLAPSDDFVDQVGFTDLHRKITNVRDEGFALESILGM
ncbi:hypothetical protein FOQG_12747 [Fusarium oxysporum f. sp. raphani 54005]|uniref:Uncharacterized protein n=1 Tax=Fusarium oxysporum f. sp. raphani 54005 TaxID=1089458 RepID=X0BWN3_FUSOX|nr:hypothetical protein FOQG_12747 [Fusarium oxysporum f. sp. raphani 54005]